MKRRLLILALAGTALAVLIAQLRKPAPVYYEGKSALDWARELNGPMDTQPARHIFQKAGPEAVPVLAYALEKNDSLLKKPVEWLAPKLPDQLGIALHRIFRPGHPENLRTAAASALALMGPKAQGAVPELAEALKDDNGNVALRAAHALAAIGPASAPVLAQAVRENRRQTRLMGMHGIALLGWAASNAAPVLAECLADPDDEIRARAGETLTQIEPQSAVSSLLAKLDHPRAEVRLLVVSVLGKIGPMARPALPELQQCSRHSDAKMRQAALQAMISIRPAGPEVRAALNEAARDPDEQVRAKAWELMPAAGFEDGALNLQRALEEESVLVRITVARRLGELAPERPLAKTLLQALARDTNAAVQAIAREGLERMPDPP